MKFKTMSVHSGQRIDPQTGALTTPLYQSSTFSYFNAQRARSALQVRPPALSTAALATPPLPSWSRNWRRWKGPTKRWWWRAAWRR